MKKIMILGAGEGQLPFINICKKRGYYVIVVSISGNYPGFKLADKSYFVDTKNKDEILNIARLENIDAILTDQTDVSVPTVAYVSEQLGLRGIGYDTSLKFSNKFLMRKAAKEAGVYVPDFAQTNSFDEAKSIAKRIGFPLMIKPVDSSGSRGVYKINSIKELCDNFFISQKYSANGYVILEQFIKGKEYLVDGFAMNNKYINLDLGVKEYFDVSNIFVSKMCMFSSASRSFDNIGNEVLETNKKLVEGIGLPFGITHAEYLYSKEEDKVYLVEIAARGGGVFLSSDITPAATGFNSNESLINYVVEGQVLNIDNVKLDTNVSAWICFTFPKGKIISIEGVSETLNLNGVYKFDLNDVYIGKDTEQLKDDSGKYGPILIKGTSEEECYKVIDQVKSIVVIKVKTDNGIENMIW